MGSDFSKQDAVHRPTIDQRNLESLRTQLQKYKPPKRYGDCVNILLYGMVGAGKSTTINTFLSALHPKGKTINCVPVGVEVESLTPELRSYKWNSLKFWDPSGWNFMNDPDRARKLLTMILEGKVPQGTNLKHFNPNSDDPMYPVIQENVIHGVALIFNTFTMDHIPEDTKKLFQELQTIVAQKYIYRIVIGTNFDRLGISEKYHHLIYEYKPLQQKFVKFSANTGVEKRTMFALSNQWNGDTIEQSKCVLALYALENMVRNIDQFFKTTE